MYKKKDKFKTIGQQLKLRNIKLDDVEDVYHFESQKNTRTKSSKTLAKKGESTFKSNVKLVRGRVLEVKANYVYKVELGTESNDTSHLAFLGEIIESHKPQTTNHESQNCILSGRLKYLIHESRNPVCVGDFVNVDMTNPDNLRIEEISERKNVLSRYIYPNNVLLASNIDQVVILASVKEPDFKAGLIDRYITAAEIANIPIVLCVNKTDLDEKNLVETIKHECEYYENSGYRVVYTSANTLEGIECLRKLLLNKVTVFSGHSGTGKSSIINALEPKLNLKVGDVSRHHSKGTHTTSSSRMLSWSFGGYLIDTPGIKTLGLKPDDIDLLASCFPGFAKYAELCAFKNCSHTHEDDCMVKGNIEKTIRDERYQSYLFLRKSLWSV